MTNHNSLTDATPDVIINTMRQKPSHEVYAIGRRALSEMMEAQVTRYGADSVAHSIGELNQAHHGWQLAEAIEAGYIEHYIPVPRR